MSRGFVYVFGIDKVQAHDGSELYKIGRSHDPVERTKNLTGQPGPVKELHRIATNNMVWLEKDLHRQYHEKRQYREWFTLDPEDLNELIQIKVRDFVAGGTLFGFPIETADLLPRKDRPLCPAAKCADYLLKQGWKARSHPAFTPEHEARLVIVQLNKNRIAAGGRTEDEAWWHAFRSWSLFFLGRKGANAQAILNED
jgi:hypothetical protein